jgi:hypothetical protein
LSTKKSRNQNHNPNAAAAAAAAIGVTIPDTINQSINNPWIITTTNTLTKKDPYRSLPTLQTKT